MRVAALEAVPGWAWVRPEAAWEENLAALRAYVGAHGRLPPKAHPSGLGIWVHSQRQARTAVGSCMRAKSTPARVAALEAVPGWTWHTHRAAWEEKLAALHAYIDAHGRLPPHRDTSGLGAWVSDQGVAKKAMDAGGASKQMTPARVAALEAVPGWVWGGRRGGSKRRRPDGDS